MPSTATTTKKPNNGSCAACNKEGAVLRCAPCRDAGVDVFFCNRDCQVKHWKIHKAVCKKTSTTKPKKEQSSVNKEANAEGKKELQLRKDTNLCLHCLKSGADIGFKLSMCSKCNSAYYCSRECQVAHWPRHKSICKQNCEAYKGMERSLDAREMNIHILCQKWIAKIRAMNCYSDVVHYALKTKGIRVEQQPPVKAVRMEIEFNYNAQTFVVVEAPTTVAIADLSQKHEESIKKMLKETDRGIERGYTHVVIIDTKDQRFTNNVAIGITKSELDQMNATHVDMFMIRNRYAKVRLKSDLFRGWKSIRRNNLRKQIEQMNLGQSYTAFVQNVLQFFCNKSLRNTHRIVVYMKMGQEIGQISQLLHYAVMPITEFKKHKEAVQKIMSHVEEIESRPFPCNISAIETLFVDLEIFFAFEHTEFCGVNVTQNKTAKQCKKAADKHYQKLQQSVQNMPSDLLEKVSL